MKCVALLPMLPAALLVSAVSSAALGREVNLRAASGTPVERVVSMLKDLKEKMELDKKAEQKVYDKYACWCENTAASKASAITEAQNQLRALGQDVLSLKGKIATRASEIEQLEADIRATEKEQDEATAMRQKENAAFMGEAEETKLAMAGLEKAILVLIEGSKPSSLLQQRSSTEVVATVKGLVEAMPVSKSLKPEQLSLLSGLLSAGAGAEYTPQSSTVQGMLKDMYETFATDLQSAYEAEATANTNFEGLIAVKATEIAADEKSKKGKQEEKVAAEAQLADTQKMYDDTTAQKEADIAFFDETKSACQKKHAQQTTRTSLRDEEIAGVDKALEILTSDDARELFDSAITEEKDIGLLASSVKEGKEVGVDDDTIIGVSSFFQVDLAPARHAYDSLKAQARATHSFRLAALAVQVREAEAGHFDKVLSAIDGMIQTLKEEGKADTEKRDQCKAEYAKIDVKVNDVSWKIEKNEAKIDKLEKNIEQLTEEKKQTIDEIAQVTSQMATLTKDRKAEHEAYSNAKNEDQDAIALLTQAKSALSAFYNKNEIDVGFVQRSAESSGRLQQQGDQAPDGTISDKSNRADESKGIVAIMARIIQNLNDEIKEGDKAEEVAQLDYEKQTAAAEKLKEELIVKKGSLTTSIAKRGKDKETEVADKKANENDSADEKTYKESITSDCDWIIGAFEKRAAARDAEMDGLFGAQKYLRGYQPDEAALIEEGKSKAFDDSALRRIRFLGLGF